MSSILSVENAYQAIATEILEYIDGRPWDKAKGVYQILSKSTSHEWCLTMCDQDDETGRVPTFDASDALFFLRDNLLATTGDRIWGLTFTLFPDGKFKIDYDYNKPEDYEETDEVISLDEALLNLPMSRDQER